MKALETVGLVHTLAEPNLTAVSGETAKFLAGGEFPVPAGSDAQGNIYFSDAQRNAVWKLPAAPPPVGEAATPSLGNRPHLR